MMYKVMCYALKSILSFNAHLKFSELRVQLIAYRIKVRLIRGDMEMPKILILVPELSNIDYK